MKELVKYIAFSNEKFLIFVPSISEGNKIKNMLEKMNPNTKIPMITSEKKKENGTYVNKIWNQIINDHCFEARILIATAVLDNGISIHDSKLRNMVILASTREEFLQMLGRRRLLDGENMNVIIMCRKKSYYETKRDREYLPLIKAYDAFERKSDIFNITKAWNGNRKIYEQARRFSVLDPKKKSDQLLTLNIFSKFEFLYNYMEYNNIVELFDYTDDIHEIYSCILRTWFGIADLKLQPLGRPRYDLCEELCGQLDMLVNKKFRKREFQIQFNSMHALMNKVFRLKNFKSNDNVTIKVLNDFFDATGLPYRAEKENKRSGVLYGIIKTND